MFYFFTAGDGIFQYLSVLKLTTVLLDHVTVSLELLCLFQFSLSGDVSQYVIDHTVYS